MAGLNDVLDKVIPWAILLFFAGLFYFKLKGPINEVFGWFKKMFGWGKDSLAGTANVVTEITYQ